MTAAASAARRAISTTALAIVGCAGPDEPAAVVADIGRPLATLAEFPVGVAVPAGDRPNSLLGSPERQALVQRHFDSITAENIMKMAYLHPAPNAYAFDDADVLVAWARERGLKVHGHALVWHQQAPGWMTAFEGEPDELSRILDEHVRTVAGHFAGRLVSWDVVNEAFTDEAPSDYRDTVWYRRIGPGYIEQAFRAARDADPGADLYYNDYNISGAYGPHKLDRILVMADDFRRRGVPLDGIGFQMHIEHDRPDAAAMREAFGKVVARGLKVRISELDVSLNASGEHSGLSPELADIQRLKYAEVARAYGETVPRALQGGITVWGITDGDSWIPGFRDRADWPLLFNADFTAKPALHGLAAGLADDSPAAGFDWFEYRGEDAMFTPPPPAGHYQNPVLAGFFPDPSIVRRGDDYYMVHSSFAWLPGIPVQWSRNLVNWELVGHVLTRASQADFDGLGVSRGIFAPTIRFHGGLFYIVSTAVDAGGNFYASAADPAGPWSEPVWLPEIDGIDPDLYFDEDGRAWLAHNGPPPGEPVYDGHRAIWLTELDLAGRRIRPGSRRLLVDGGSDIRRQPVWIEGPHLLRKDGWIYLICAEGGTGDRHSEVVFRARALDEPFLPFAGNPILTQRDLDPGREHPVTSTGHADFVQTAAGDWWAVFLATRPYAPGLSNTGRETFLLPVSWADGWPQVLPQGRAVPWQPARPEGLPTVDVTAPQTGNFTWRDEFAGPTPGHVWSLLRRVEAPWLTYAGGALWLAAGPESLSGSGQPAFLARRQQHQRFRAATALRLPDDPAVSAGLAAFQNETHHYYFGIRTHDGMLRAFVERAAGGPAVTVAAQDLPGAGTRDAVEVAVVGDRGTLDFLVRTGDEAWLPVAHDLDATILSSEVAGGFVGTMLGPHARRESRVRAPDSD